MEDKASNLDAVLKEAVDLVRAPPFTTSPPLELTNLSSILSRAVTFVFEGGFGDRLVPVLLGSAHLRRAAASRTRVPVSGCRRFAPAFRGFLECVFVWVEKPRRGGLVCWLLLLECLVAD